MSHIFSIPIIGQSTEILQPLIMDRRWPGIGVHWSFCTDDFAVSTGYFTAWPHSELYGIKSIINVPPGKFIIFYKMRFISSDLEDQFKRLLQQKLRLNRNAKSEFTITCGPSSGCHGSGFGTGEFCNSQLAKLSHDQWRWVPVTRDVAVPVLSLTERMDITVYLHADPLLRFFAIHGVTFVYARNVIRAQRWIRRI